MQVTGNDKIATKVYDRSAWGTLGVKERGTLSTQCYPSQRPVLHLRKTKSQCLLRTETLGTTLAISSSQPRGPQIPQDTKSRLHPLTLILA